MVDHALLEYLETFISEERRHRFREVLRTRTRFLTVVMEDVFQLHNTSAVLRSCEVFGIQDLHVIEAQFSRRPDKNIALGAQQWVDLYRYSQAGACLKTLKGKGYQIVATSPSIGGCPLEEFNPKQPSALLFGTEKEGLSEELLQAADLRLQIPMVGFTESLNISVAASIILYRLSTQLRCSEVHWQLSEEEVFEKLLDWTMKSIKDSAGILKRYDQKSCLGGSDPGS